MEFHLSPNVKRWRIDKNYHNKSHQSVWDRRKSMTLLCSPRRHFSLCRHLFLSFLWKEFEKNKKKNIPQSDHKLNSWNSLKIKFTSPTTIIISMNKGKFWRPSEIHSAYRTSKSQKHVRNCRRKWWLLIGSIFRLMFDLNVQWSATVQSDARKGKEFIILILFFKIKMFCEG